VAALVSFSHGGERVKLVVKLFESYRLKPQITALEHPNSGAINSGIELAMENGAEKLRH
jgi:hypothetical protein